MTAEIVTAIIGLVVVVVVALLRNNFGPAKTGGYAEWATSTLNLAGLWLKAAEAAVVQVEEVIKKHQDLSGEELKQAALDYAQQILQSWGIYVDPKVIAGLEALIEKAYQDLKEKKQDWLMGEQELNAQ